MLSTIYCKITCLRGNGKGPASPTPLFRLAALERCSARCLYPVYTSPGLSVTRFGGLLAPSLRLLVFTIFGSANFAEAGCCLYRGTICCFNLNCSVYRNENACLLVNSAMGYLMAKFIRIVQSHDTILDDTIQYG